MSNNRWFLLFPAFSTEIAPAAANRDTQRCHKLHREVWVAFEAPCGKINHRTPRSDDPTHQLPRAWDPTHRAHGTRSAAPHRGSRNCGELLDARRHHGRLLQVRVPLSPCRPASEPAPYAAAAEDEAPYPPAPPSLGLSCSSAGESKHEKQTITAGQEKPPPGRRRVDQRRNIPSGSSTLCCSAGAGCSGGRL
jgi:hypothetical protein